MYSVYPQGFVEEYGKTPMWYFSQSSSTLYSVIAWTYPHPESTKVILSRGETFFLNSESSKLNCADLCNNNSCFTKNVANTITRKKFFVRETVKCALPMYVRWLSSENQRWLGTMKLLLYYSILLFYSIFISFCITVFFCILISSHSGKKVSLLLTLLNWLEKQQLEKMEGIRVCHWKRCIEIIIT